MRFSVLLGSSMLFLLTLCDFQRIEAGFSNNGRMVSKNLNLSVNGTLDNNGELIASESANLSCDTLSGKGLISAPQISIKSKMFAFTGTIECEGKCTIVAASPFNDRMFKRKGKGQFIIIVDKNMNVRDGFRDDCYIADEFLIQAD